METTMIPKSNWSYATDQLLKHASYQKAPQISAKCKLHKLAAIVFGLLFIKVLHTIA